MRVWTERTCMQASADATVQWLNGSAGRVPCQAGQASRVRVPELGRGVFFFSKSSNMYGDELRRSKRPSAGSDKFKSFLQFDAAVETYIPAPFVSQPVPVPVARELRKPRRA